ncbi:hypothetical protein LCGC14_2267740, partial [marine sediment metagenome]
MPVYSLTEAIDNLYTSTWQHMRGGAIDNIFDATPFWFWMKDKGRLRTQSGGRHILEPLEYAKNDGVKFLGKGGTVSLNDREFLTEALYDWRYLVAPLVRFGVDDQVNRGKTKILSLIEAKLSNAENSLVDTLETTLFADVGTAGGAFDGLQHLVQEDPTSSTVVGSINQSTNSWWQNRFKTLIGVSFATSGVDEMRTLLNKCTNNRLKDRPDIIVSGQLPFEYYEDAAFAKLEIKNTKLAELGFDHQTFKGIPMIWSPACSDETMYFLNTTFLSFVYDPAMFFDM